MPPEGEKFKPSEPYTDRLKKILVEYPDGSQILREILQNSDDAKSTEQIFILDHNTYSSDNLFDQKLDGYQGPALLAKNNENFEEKDFKSLLKLANSEKHDQFDKIGVMGVGFNSIYHITDLPSFITDDKYVILDPHEWCYDGGKKFNFIKNNLAEEYPNQFAPFRIPCNESYDSPFKNPFKGTIFRYPLRTSDKSEISKKIYEPKYISDMFDTFYEKDSINCLLFLKYIERISFYEIKKGAKKLDLLYSVQLENANQVRQQRCMIAKSIAQMMDLLNSGKLNDDTKLETSYVASFSRQKGVSKEPNSEWLILNYLDDLLETEKYFQKEFKKSIREYKFIPNVGLAVPLNNLNAIGGLFCFLPLPIHMPFTVSVHGYFAVSTNRRSLWSAADKEDLAHDSLALLKVTWNEYLFEKVLPRAWVKFLRELPSKVSNIPSNQIYKFWPIVKVSKSGSTSSINYFCKDLLQNVIENLDVEDRIFKGPSSSNAIGTVSKVSADAYDASSFKESEFHWLSLSNGYLEDEKSFLFDFPRIVGNIGFPVITAPPDIIRVLKISRHKDLLNLFSPAVARDYLKRNRARWDNNAISRKEVLQLLEYILIDQKFDELEGFRMIPLANGTLGTLTQSGNSYVYIGPDDGITNDKIDERDIFESQLSKFIDNSIENYGLYRCLYKHAKAGWRLNIKILDEFAVANLIKCSLNTTNVNSEEIQISNRREWIYKLWKNLMHRNWDLTQFEDIHLIPTNCSTLRKLKTSRKIFSSQTRDSILISIFKKFGAVFVDYEFDNSEISRRIDVSLYIVKPNDIISVLNSFRADNLYPKNLKKELQSREALALVEHLSTYSRSVNIHQNLIEVIQYLPIFTEVGHTLPISLLPGNKNWYLLPREDEMSYGKIIFPSNKGGFLNTSTQNLCYILEDIIKIPRLSINDYWRHCVIPFLESQSPRDIDIVVDKLFDRLPSLRDANFRDVLGGKSFVPAGTLKMSREQKVPADVMLVKPIELFDPEEKTVVDLFFDDEKVFPAGKYGGISQSRRFSSKFLSNLKLLGIKSDLSPDDIISRINTIVKRRQSSGVHKDLIHSKASKLFKYIDENWGDLNNNHLILKAISEKEWIPTVDKSGNKFFSKPQNCYCQENKYLVSLVVPVVEFKVKNENFMNHLGWNTYPKVEKILEQLDLCRVSVSNREPPENLEKIRDAIYSYMNKICQTSDETSKRMLKKNLRNKSWILLGNKFYSIDKVFFNLPNRFRGNDSIVELPKEYKNRFENLFKFMGVQDEMGVKDLILIIKNMVKGDENKVLPINEITDVVQILEQIGKTRREGANPERLDELLVPSTENILEKLHEIHFDDMGDRLSGEEKSAYKIAHCDVKLHIAERLEIQTLSGKICGGDLEYEQSVSLISKIKTVIEDYSINSLFKEFLQNADDAKATRFSITVDERKHINNTSNKSFLSKEIEDWQGPAVWIYNDAKFSDIDFKALIKLGESGKSLDDTKIGRFGLGFNCVFHLTDLPSFVSGKYIVFLDPNAKYLPTQGYPPRRLRGTRYNFIEKEFKRIFPDQCYPYEAMGCDFSKEFEGTLFRLPLRTLELAKKSEISDEFFKIEKILRIFEEIQDNNEMLFLKNIESCSLYRMTDRDHQFIWEAKINNIDSCRNSRREVIDTPQVYRLDIEKNLQNKKISEMWAICIGGHDNIIDQELKEFSGKRHLKPRGGVASLLNRYYKNEPKNELFPEFAGEIYSYLSLSIATNLGVHLNGNFSLSSARISTLQSESLLQANSDDAKWNRYILSYVLPDLHIKLLEYIVELEKERHIREGSNLIPHITNNLWPIRNNLTTNLYKRYGLNVIKKLGRDNHRIFWTEANGGQFIPLKEAKVFGLGKTIIADILTSSGISTVKLDNEKIIHLNEIIESDDPQDFPYTTISGESICKELQMSISLIPSFKREDNITYEVNSKKYTHASLYELLNFILQDKRSFGALDGLPLVPLSDGSVGKFGKVYYIGKQKHLDLFPKSLSRFVSIDLPKGLSEIFNDDGFAAITNIKKFGATAILDLLNDVIRPVKELKWDPNGRSIPNKIWLDKIWSILNKDAEDIDFTKLSNFPLLPVIQPSNMLVQPDIASPLLYKPANGKHILFQILVKLKVRFTDMICPESAHEYLKKCIVECTSTNIINSLSPSSTMNLLPLEYERLRNFIKEEIDTLIEHGQSRENFMNILRSLPIWPVHSSNDKFIDATSGKLLTYELTFFSFHKNTNFYKCNHESDFNALTKLGATSVSALDYIRHYILPPIYPPSRDYIIFLQSVLSLGNRDIEQYLKHKPVIPNRSLTAYEKANTLYDTNDILLRNVFADADKFLPLEFQNNTACLEALRRMGLNCQVDCNIYIKCAREIESQIQQERIRTHAKDRAKQLVRYLYEHINTLDFNNEQWNEIIRIKFVPSQVNLSDQFYKTPKETSGFESFNALCLGRYKKLCWTQCPMFDEDIEPTTSFNERHSGIGMPSIENIIEHWIMIADMSRQKSWTTGYGCAKQLKSVIKEIYEKMNEVSQNESFKVLIISKIDNPEKKLFLNEDEPFKEKNWVAGRELVFGIQKDIIEGTYKVKECLADYKALLLLAGAHEVKDLKPTPKNGKHDQKDMLLKASLDKLERQDNKYHDIIFVVGKEKEEIGASKYILTCASEYFEKMFHGGLSESEMGKIPVKNVKPATFWILLRWLYGQSFKDATDATNSVLSLDFLGDILKAADYYRLPLKDDVEYMIINGPYIDFINVCKVLSWKCDAAQLKDYCKNYINQNKKFVIEKLSEHENKERSEILEMLNSLLSD